MLRRLVPISGRLDLVSTKGNVMHTRLVFFAVVVALAVSAPVAAEQKPIIKPTDAPTRPSVAHDDEAPKATRKGVGVEQKPVIKPTVAPTVPITKPAGGPTKPSLTHDDESPKERVFRPGR